MTDQELAADLGTIHVGGKMLTGRALMKYLNLMPPADKESMLDDLAQLRAWAMIEKSVPVMIKKV